MYKHKHNKPTYLHSLPKLLRLFVVTENYQVNHMSFDHSGTIFFPLGFCSASHADSSFVGASDIGQWFTPGSRCNFGSRWNLAHTQVVSNLGTRGSTDQMPVESPSSPNQGLTGIKGNQRHSLKMIKTFPFAVISHSFSGSQSAPIPDGIGCSNPA